MKYKRNTSFLFFGGNLDYNRVRLTEGQKEGKQMNREEMMKYVDHTLLRATASWEEIEKLCEEAVRFGAASVCIPPCYVKRVRDMWRERLTICTVVGFPLGYSVTAAKLAETKQALEDGASEIDMVINLTDVKNGNFSAVEQEIRTLKEAVGSRVLKVIVETCYLTGEEKIRLCECVTDAGADFIKTSTGFGTAGAAVEDIRLFRSHVGKNVRIKAAGGIRSAADMEALLEAGADRLGMSSAVEILFASGEKKD